MAGLFGTLGMAARSLQVQQLAIEITGHNLANVSNPAYARQRAVIQAGLPIPTNIGLIGTGVDATGIQQIRSTLLDGQIQADNSSLGYWTSQQTALQFAQAGLGQQIQSTSSASDATNQSGLAGGLADLFNAFQNLSTNPTSLAERQVLLLKAQALASQFNQASARLTTLRTTLNTSIQDETGQANRLLGEIAELNDQIAGAELKYPGPANDLRDLRQGKIEELAKLAKIDTAAQPNGTINITIGGELIVDDKNVLDTLQAYDAGGGQYLVRTTTGGVPLTLGGGSLQGTIDVRDGAVATLASDLDAVAAGLSTEVNAVHAGGFSLTGSTGENFFTGTTAGTLGVNATLANNPALIQASGTAGAVGDNQVALRLAQLAQTTFPAFSGQTFSQRYSQSVASLGQAIDTTNTRLADEQTVQDMLLKQRSSVSGVSVDEEVTNLTTYQHAYQASARLVSVVDELLDTIIRM